MPSKTIERYIAEHNERKYYVYADSIAKAKEVFETVIGFPPKYISIDTDPWLTKIEENWNANIGKALSPENANTSLSVACPNCGAKVGSCCLINGLRRMHLAHDERVLQFEKQTESKESDGS